MNLYGKIIGSEFLQLLAQIYFNAIWKIDKLLKLGLCERDTQINEILSTKIIGERQFQKAIDLFTSVFIWILFLIIAQIHIQI